MTRVLVEILFRIGVVLPGFLVLAFGVGFARNYRGAADFLSSRVSPDRLERDSNFNAQTRPIVFQLLEGIAAL